MSVPEAQASKRRRAKITYAPLSYERQAILIALAGGPLDRAEVASTIIGDTIGALVLSKSSFYRLINESEVKGYIEARGAYYLTDKGWRTLHQELNRIERQRLILKQRLHA
jgi:DNA-binding PadR family transcriptional regulator